MVTIKDVAAHAGVAFKTVSRVVNNDPTVKPANRDKVLASIEELGYRPNRAAQMTRRKKSGVIGFIADELLRVPYTFDLIRGAQDLAWKNNKELMVLNVNVDKYSVEGAINHLLGHRVEGIIYAAMYHREVTLPEQLTPVPTVLANCFDPSKRFASIVPDEKEAAREITAKMLNKGYRRIVFLNLNENIIAGQQRKAGAEQAFAEHKGKNCELHIESVIIGEEGNERSVTRQRAAELIENFKPDAILCGQDPMAVEVYFVAQSLGLKVGENIGIGSFDDWDIIPTLLQPSLTTMALPHYDMGQWAINYLLNERTDIVSQTAKFNLINRDSF
ncbi:MULTISPECIES: LacI family DNA-binding transcriptional regulator [Alteromonas]|jgi:LacI family transcriptional regulator|uniref:LacI family DNA-binding transcriptional regulator n=1 Tax=Alteromonas stellipolaris TaxID=233316 RepID=A0AAW7Z6U7_9ALTE|nr:LacI family DNA-binding transcriptional regulator [Alteromonas stellipolaris]ALM89534.1 regulatory protein, LacI:Periplasmic binding protein/LacI transcriptional regulator [Alteromonas stellipolaris LMG 21856]AMJ75352.1 LacI family transcriptional regulator [Alteromonas stellipolaris]MDO6578378.1 LacI family DNA-binding transcriptional regulator [Alteromonas stellipolaris]MDP2594688.1 LacI family DNA-binding transcriptional regulator [Alteromonas stellipolaris]